MNKDYYYFSGELEDIEDLEREVERVEHMSSLFNPNEEKVLDFAQDLCYPISHDFKEK